MKKEQVVGTTIVRITCSIHVAPQVGLEPTTTRLTAACSTDWAIEEYWYLKDTKALLTERLRIFSSGDDLLSRAASRQVSSALQSLTSVFGMGTGVTSASLSPDKSFYTLKIE